MHACTVTAQPADRQTTDVTNAHTGTPKHTYAHYHEYDTTHVHTQLQPDSHDNAAKKTLTHRETVPAQYSSQLVVSTVDVHSITINSVIFFHEL